MAGNDLRSGDLILGKWRNQIRRHRPDRLGEVPEGDRSRVTSALLQPADIGLCEAGRFRNLVLSQAFRLPQTRKVSADGFAHIHSTEVEELDAARYSL